MSKKKPRSEMTPEELENARARDRDQKKARRAKKAQIKPAGKSAEPPENETKPASETADAVTAPAVPIAEAVELIPSAPPVSAVTAAPIGTLQPEQPESMIFSATDLETLQVEPSAAQEKAKEARALKRSAANTSADAAAKLANPAAVAELKAGMGRLYDIIEVAAALGLSMRAVKSYIRSGKLAGVKIGGTWRVSMAALRKFTNPEESAM